MAQSEHKGATLVIFLPMIQGYDLAEDWGISNAEIMNNLPRSNGSVFGRTTSSPTCVGS